MTTSAVPGQKAKLLRLAEVTTEIVVNGEDEVVFADVGYRVSHPLLVGLAAFGTGGLVLFTSGSAGKPKAVVHDAERFFVRYRTPGRARRTIPFMLFDHVGGINTVLQTLAAGGTAVIAPNRHPETICLLIEKHRVQVLPTTPTFLNLLLLSDFRAHDLSSLETIAYGAERMPSRLLAGLSDAFPGVKLIQNYGLSEAGILHTSSEANESLWLTLRGDGVATRVANGQLEIKSESAMLGYLGEDSPFTEDGWLKTGDRVEVKGRSLRILGRESDVINVGGEKVHPSEIEDLVAEMPYVLEVVVGAQPNAIMGQLVRAEVWLSREETREDFRRRMIEFLSGKVPEYKIPQRVALNTRSLQGARLKLRRSFPEYERDVSGTDRGFIARDAFLPPTIIQLVLEGDGSPTPETLREALRRTSEANPGSCLVLDEAGSEPIWKVGPPPALTVIDAPAFEARDNHAAPFFESPLNARTGPTCSLFLVRGKTKTYLIFRALHAVMDGQGVRCWAQDFARCLRGEEPEGHASSITVDQLTREMAAPRRPMLPRDALHPFGPANRDCPTGQFHWKRITANRPLDAKVSGRIGVALANRARARGEAGAFRLAMPADLRHYRPHERTTANFFGGLQIEVPPGAEADDVAFRIVQALYTHESIKLRGLYANESVASLAATQVAIYFDLAHVDDTGRYYSSAMLSNLGVLKSAELSAPGFRVTSAFFVPLEGDVGCTTTLNGYDQHTEVVVGLSDRFASNGRFEAFVDLVRAAVEPSVNPKLPNVEQKHHALSGVSETAILTLRARAEEHERSDRLYSDPTAADWFRRITWPTKLDRWWSSTNAGRGIAMRADAIDHLVAQYHSRVLALTVTELGCGLSTRRNRLSHLSIANWIDVDLPEVVELRRTLGATGTHVAASVMDFSWMDELRGDPSQQLFVAEGLLYYLERAQVDALFLELKRRFSGAAIVFDVVGANDYATLLENTASAGAPIAWHLDGNYSDALKTFGLGVIGELDPDRLMNEAIARYWHRFTNAERVAGYFVMHSAELMRGRSGTVLGRFE